jgi:hypothetical protein
MGQMNELRSYISRAAGGISLGASLVILGIELPGGIAQAVGLGDALPAASTVSMAGVIVWTVCRVGRARS